MPVLVNGYPLDVNNIAGGTGVMKILDGLNL